MAPVLEGKSIGSYPKNTAKVYNPTQGFNLLQISPNWFLGNMTLDPRLKWAFICCLGDLGPLDNKKNSPYLKKKRS
jgi:hypothetical protein